MVFKLKYNLLSGHIMSYYLCVLDFEATCWKDHVRDSQEIIEFPSVLYRLDPVYKDMIFPSEPVTMTKQPVTVTRSDDHDPDDDAFGPAVSDIDRIDKEEGTDDQEVEEPVLLKYIPTFISEFAKYVKPVLNPKLSSFCTELTGITQKTVDSADIFETVYHEHHNWLLEHVPNDANLAFVTVGNWDMQTMLPKEVRNKKLRLYRMYKQFINIKSEFDYFYKKKSGSMVNMLQQLGIPLSGKHHSGIDDTRNTAQILLRMLDDGHTEFQVQTVWYK